MKIRMKRFKYKEVTLLPGCVYDVDDNFGEEMIKKGVAEKIKTDAEPAPAKKSGAKEVK